MQLGCFDKLGSREFGVKKPPLEGVEETEGVVWGGFFRVFGNCDSFPNLKKSVPRSMELGVDARRSPASADRTVTGWHIHGRFFQDKAV